MDFKGQESIFEVPVIADLNCQLLSYKFQYYDCLNNFVTGDLIRNNIRFTKTRSSLSQLRYRIGYSKLISLILKHFRLVSFVTL